MMQSVKEGNPGTPVNVRKRTTFSTPPKHLGDTNRHTKDTQVKSENGIETKGACKSISYSGKVVCRACEKPINGLIVQALGETWHQEHFLCSECKKPITSNRFNVEQGKPYCEEDYANIFLKKCSGCKAPIRDVVVVALNRTWHKDHFICTMCGTKLASKGFFEKEDNPFCQECYEQKFCPKCSECGSPITDTAVMALGKKWHQDCFRCKNCNKPVVDSTFEVIGNRPLCSTCISQMSKV